MILICPTTPSLVGNFFNPKFHKELFEGLWVMLLKRKHSFEEKSNMCRLGKTEQQIFKNALITGGNEPYPPLNLCWLVKCEEKYEFPEFLKSKSHQSSPLQCLFGGYTKFCEEILNSLQVLLQKRNMNRQVLFLYPRQNCLGGW